MDFHRIAVGVDLGASRRELTPGTRRALEQARVLAERWGARITVVRSGGADEHWDPEHGWVFVDADGPESAEALEALASEIGAAVHSVHVDPERALSELVLRGEADLVMVGKRSVPGIDGRRLGSVALKCLRSCPCALWVVDPDAPPRLGRVLAATDLSPVGERVLRIAAGVAATFGSEFHVVHALQVPLSAQMEHGEPSWLAEARQRAAARVTRCLQDTPMAGKAKLHLAPSPATRAILEAARALEPELVVLGTISRGGLAGLLVGNTAERVLPQLDASLLAVKPADFVSPFDAPVG